jgi:hypothetical protein
MKRFVGIVLLSAGLALLAGQPASARENVALLYTSGAPQAEFAGAEIRLALEARGNGCLRGSLDDLAKASGNVRIVLAASADEAKRLATDLGLAPLKAPAAQSYAMRKKADGSRTTYAVLATDPTGAMYGGLDVAEAIRLGTLADLKDSDHAPHIERRGIKFNIPLDARTPSYSDAGDARSAITRCWAESSIAVTAAARYGPVSPTLTSPSRCNGFVHGFAHDMRNMQI